MQPVSRGVVGVSQLNVDVSRASVDVSRVSADVSRVRVDVSLEHDNASCVNGVVSLSASESNSLSKCLTSLNLSLCLLN